MTKGTMIGTGGIDLSRYSSIKYLKITGEQIFYYADSSYETVPTPQAITLRATLYNLNLLNGNKIKWYYSKGASGWAEIVNLNRAATATDALTISYNHECWQSKNTATIKAAFEYKGKVYEDEFTLAKLAKGSDAYTVLLSEESQMFPTDEYGGYNKQQLMKDCTVQVSVFKGTTKLKYQTQFEVTQVTQSTDSLVISIGGDYNGEYAVITPTELKGEKSTAQLIVTIGDFVSSSSSSGKTRVTKSMSITKGKAGKNGESAKVVKITGGNFFKRENEVYTPNVITLTALLQNIDVQTHRAVGGSWSYSIDRQTWKPCTNYEISESDSFSLINIYPNSTGFDGNIIYYKYEINETLYDIASIGKVLDGKDGIGYSIFLSNDSENIPTDSNGTVSSDYLGENGKTFTTVDVYYSSGTELTQLTPSRSLPLQENQYYIRVLNSEAGLDVATVSETTANKVYLSSLRSESKNFEIEIELKDGKTFSKIFTVTKSTPIKGDPGTPGQPGQDGKPGQDGQDTVIADLTNDSHLIPITPDGAESYYGCESTLELFKGYTQINNSEIEFTFTKSSNVSGLPSLETPGKYIVMEVMGETGWVDFTGLYKGVYYTKRFTITKVQSGADAEPAKFVTVSGEQIFKYDGDTPNKQEILVSATIHGSKNKGVWQYWDIRDAAQDGWSNYLKNGNPISALDLKVGHTDYELATRDSMTVRYVVNLGETGQDGSTEIEISDQLTIVKVTDGSDTYNAILSNESHTVTCDDTGTPLSGELGSTGKAITELTALRGANILNPVPLSKKNEMTNSEFCYEIDSEVGCRALRKSDSEVYIETLNSNSGTVNIRFHMGSDKKSVVKKMSISKAKQGIGGLFVSLTNDSHQFFSDYNGNIEQPITTTTTAQALLGLTPTSIKSITCSNKPAGMELSIMTPTITITASKGSSLPDQGTLDFIITVGTTQTTKQFSWVKTKNGTPGTNGKPGEDGKSYDLAVEGGARVFNYTQLSSHPVPNSTGTYSIKLYENGVLANNKIETCSWVGYGLIQGSGTGLTFSPNLFGTYKEVNSYIEATVVYIYKGDERATRKITVPISATRDAIGLDWVQDWDGKKTKIGDEYILTGKIFAGESAGVANSVTGVAMGKHMWGTAREEVGLAAYHKGVNTFALTTQGEMYIGNPSASGSAGIKFLNNNTLEIVADKIQIKNMDLSGKFTSIESSISGVTTTVGDNAGNISVLQQTATTLSSKISDAEGNISKLQQTAKDITLRVEGAEGSISELKVTTKGLESTVSGKLNSSDFTSTLAQNADTILAQVNNKSGSTSSGIKIHSSGVDVLNNKVRTMQLTKGKMYLYNSSGTEMGYYGTSTSMLETYLKGANTWQLKGDNGMLMSADFKKELWYGKGTVHINGNLLVYSAANDGVGNNVGIYAGNDDNWQQWGLHNIFMQCNNSIGFMNWGQSTTIYFDTKYGNIHTWGDWIKNGKSAINTYSMNIEESGFTKEELVESIYNLETNLTVHSEEDYNVYIEPTQNLLLRNNLGDDSEINYTSLVGCLVETVKDLNNRIKELEGLAKC